MDDTINLDQIQTNGNFDFANLYTAINDNEDDIYNDSPLSLNPNECKNLTTVEFSNAFQSDKVSLSMLCINCRRLAAHCDSLQELFCNLSSAGLKFDMIALTKIFRIQDSQQYTINGYHSLLFNTILQNDDGHGGIGIYIHTVLTMALHTLNGKISLYLFPTFLNLYFLKFKIIKTNHL